MPVKITNGPTDHSEGLINAGDLAKMKNDFISEVTLSRKGSSTAVIKTHKCFLLKQQLDSLFAIFGSIENPMLTINFALHLNPTPGCEAEPDISDKLTVVIEVTDNDAQRASHNSVGEFVLIPGYANSGQEEGNPVKGFVCCPSAFP